MIGVSPIDFKAVLYTPLPIVGTFFIARRHCCFHGKLLTKEVTVRDELG